MAQRSAELKAAEAAARPGAPQGGLGLAVLLTLLVAMGPVSTDLYLPSLPGIAADLEASESLAQLTIGLFIAGFAVMMLACGPLADRFGRRPVLLAGMAIYTLASIACVLATDIVFLLAARFVQALGACVGPVVGRAIVRDLYEPRAAGRILGYMSSAMALAPLIGPFIGGWLEVAFGWRANFWALAGYGGLLLAALALRLRETLRAPLSGALAPTRLLGNYLLIVRNRTFLGFMLCVSLSFGALFTWISNSAFVVIDHFGVAPERFGWVFGVVVVGYIAGAYGGSRAGMRFGLARATGLGSAICAAAGAGLLVAGWSGLGGLYAITALMALSFAGAGLAIPQGTAGGLGPFPERAGSAAALLGFIQVMIGLVVNSLSSLWYDGTPRPMVTLNALCAGLALAAFWRAFSAASESRPVGEAAAPIAAPPTAMPTGARPALPGRHRHGKAGLAGDICSRRALSCGDADRARRPAVHRLLIRERVATTSAPSGSGPLWSSGSSPAAMSDLSRYRAAQLPRGAWRVRPWTSCTSPSV